MVMFSISISIYLLLLSSHQTSCVGDDRLTANTSITLNQTIVSAGGTFALGFFNPNTSTISYYVGIWYNNIPGKEVVWVANRENPLKDSSGVLRINKDGNIALLDAKGSIFWSSNLSDVPKNSSALLLDSGNLVLRSGDDEDMWQIFDHPTDTLLPNMNMARNFKTGIGTGLTSWKTEGDPQPGNFSFNFDPLAPLQIVILKGSEIHWRSGVWTGIPVTSRSYSNSSAAVYVTLNDQEIRYSFSATVDLELPRSVLDPTGTLNFWIWKKNTKKWFLLNSWPSGPCDVYNQCGDFNICDSSGHSYFCRCLEGFVPKLQQKGNSSEGCARKMPLKCDNSDTFFKSSKMKLPDKSSYLRNRTEAQCKTECLTNCQCTAYAYAYNNNTDVPYQSRCLIWTVELIDLAMDSVWVEDLYVRVVASELDASSNNKHLEIVLPTVAVGMLISGILFFLLKKRLILQGKARRRKTVTLVQMKEHYSFDRGRNIELPYIDFNTIVAVTDNFSVANKLGEGGFGPVYKGKLLQGQEIAVKRLSKSSGQGFEEFKNEVELIAKLQHTNLVQLLGWCSNEDEKILIYEYLPNKSLDKFIFDLNRSAELDWARRFRIIGGIAHGLIYLHQYSRLRVIHRDLKTSNILLDGSMNPKISDFGLARIFGGSQTEANTEKVVGTYGYMAPEYSSNGLFSEKSDVFSFGVILLEIVSGKRSTGFYRYIQTQNLLEYAWNLWEEDRALELMDPFISSSIQASEVVKCIQVGLLCVQENAADRPFMSSVVYMLSDGNTNLPSPKQPTFATGRNPTPGAANSLSSAEESRNELTRSAVEGR